MGLNYNHKFQGLKNDLKIMELMGRPKYLAMQSLGVKGKLGEHVKNQTVPLFNSKDAFEFKFKRGSNTDSTFYHHMNSHHLAPCQVWDTKDEAKLQHE